MCDLCFPVTLLMLISIAIRILQAQLTSTSDKIIPGRAERFLSRHPSIQLKYCQYLEKTRAKITATIEEQRKCYRTLRTLMRKYKITTENLWNCDEQGIIMGLAVGRQKAIVRANRRNKLALTDGNRELCSVLETISASGHVTHHLLFGQIKSILWRYRGAQKTSNLCSIT